MAGSEKGQIVEVSSLIHVSTVSCSRRGACTSLYNIGFQSWVIQMFLDYNSQKPSLPAVLPRFPRVAVQEHLGYPRLGTTSLQQNSKGDGSRVRTVAL